MTGNLMILIQARMGSSRLPGKVMLPVCDQTVLSLMAERVRANHFTDRVAVATTTDRADDTIFDHCMKIGIDCHRGHPTDLLDRHYQIAVRTGVEHIVKIPSDCPLIDPAVIDETLGRYETGHFDYVSNLHPPSYPDGNDVEVFSLNALREAWKEAISPEEREHTTPFIWSRPNRFRIGNARWASNRNLSKSHRFTLDYEEDYQFVRTVAESLIPEKGILFSLEEILSLLSEKPGLVNLNARHLGDSWISKSPRFKQLEEEFNASF